MSTRVQFRRGTTAQHANFAGALAEVTVDTDKKTLVLHDGTTLGGFPIDRDKTLDVTRFGASTSNTSAANELAFDGAEAASSGAPIFVPDGIYQLATPMNRGAKALYYGPGVLRFDRAEWWRRGGSGGVGVNERYTLYYERDNDSDVHITINDVEVSIIGWEGPFTFLAPSSAATDSIRYWIVNGRLRLTETPESLRAYNMFAGGGGLIEPLLASPTASPSGYFNTGFGPRALQNLTSGGNCTGVGARSLTSFTGPGGNQTAVGFQTLYRTEGTSSDNTAVGSVSMEWNKTGSGNSALGTAALAANESGNFNSAVGMGALADQRSGDYNAAFGYYALGNNSIVTGAGVSSSVAIGAFAYRYGRVNSVVAVGYRALGGNGPITGDGQNVAVGFFAGRNVSTGGKNVLVGTSAGGAFTTSSRMTLVGHEAGAGANADDLTAVGYRAANAATSAVRVTAVGSGALALSNGSDNTAVGFGAGQATTSGDLNTAVGVFAAGANTTGQANTDIGRSAGVSRTSGSFNVNVGRQAGEHLIAGNSNTNIGAAAGRLLQGGANAEAVDNSTAIGASAAVSGSNQVQLGNSATTTYVYGTVQNRSDERDKADIRDTELGLEFIMALRPVDYRWDMREDYLEVDAETGELRRNDRDGSRKRIRFHHGFIAQEVMACGFEFGGLQDHSRDGGTDVLSMGYDEIIAPLVKAVQELKAANENLEARVAELEAA